MPSVRTVVCLSTFQPSGNIAVAEVPRLLKLCVYGLVDEIVGMTVANGASGKEAALRSRVGFSPVGERPPASTTPTASKASITPKAAASRTLLNLDGPLMYLSPTGVK